MDFLKDLGIQLINGFIPYLITALIAVLGTVTGYLTIKVKQIINTKIKKDCANTVVKAVEQTVIDNHGVEKFNIAKEKLINMLADYKIKISDTEVEILIESAVKSYNDIKKELQ